MDAFFYPEKPLKPIPSRFLSRFALSVLFALGGLTPVPKVAADSDRAISVERAVQLATSNRAFNALQESKISVHRGRQLAEAAFPNPNASYDREQAWEPAGTVVEDFVTLEQPLPVWGKRQLRREAAGLELRAQKASNRAHQLRAKLEIKRTFYRVLRHQKELVIARKRKRRVEKSLDIAKTQSRANQLSEYSVARLRRALDGVRAEIEQAKSDLFEQRGDFAAKVGPKANLPEHWRARGQLAPESVPDLPDLKNRVEKHPRIAVLEAKANHHSVMNEASSRSLLPTPVVRGGYKRVDAVGADISHGLVAGLSLDIPVFSQRWGERRETSAQKAKWRAKKRLRLRQLRSRLEATHRAARLAIQSSSDYRRNAVGRAEALLSRARARWKAGEGSIFELLDAHESWFDSKRRAIDKAWSARNKKLRLEWLAGSFNE